jgi:CHAD domain-containing protein
MLRSASTSKLARALGYRLVGAKKPPRPPATLDTAGEAALAYLHQQVRAITIYDPAVRRDEEDAVHQMRVATRRLRSALKSFRRELDRAATDPVGDELKWCAGVLGTERDREVLAERLQARIEELEPGPATDTLRTRLLGAAVAAHPEARRTLLHELNGERYFKLLDTLDVLLAEPPFLDGAKAPAPKALAKTVRRDHRRLRRFVEAAIPLDPGTEKDVAVHEARKAVKRARYSSEAAEAVLGKPAVKHTKRMKSLQQLLGEHQDSVMCRNAIARIAEEARAAGDDTFLYGVLDEYERSRARAIEERLPKVWRKADRGNLAG